MKKIYVQKHKYVQRSYVLKINKESESRRKDKVIYCQTKLKVIYWQD